MLTLSQLLPLIDNQSLTFFSSFKLNDVLLFKKHISSQVRFSKTWLFQVLEIKNNGLSRPKSSDLIRHYFARGTSNQ